jgi:hypothetical protein
LGDPPPLPPLPKALVSRHGRKKSKKGKGRRRQLGSGGSLEPRLLDMIMEASELEREFAEETGCEIDPAIGTRHTGFRE